MGAVEVDDGGDRSGIGRGIGALAIGCRPAVGAHLFGVRPVQILVDCGQRRQVVAVGVDEVVDPADLHLGVSPRFNRVGGIVELGIGRRGDAGPSPEGRRIGRRVGVRSVAPHGRCREAVQTAGKGAPDPPGRICCLNWRTAMA